MGRGSTLANLVLVCEDGLLSVVALSSGRHTCVAETLFSKLLTLFPTPDDRPTVLAGLPAVSVGHQSYRSPDRAKRKKLSYCK